MRIIGWTLALVLMSAAPAWAQLDPELELVDGCLHLSWTANTESDLAGYRIYLTKSGEAQPMIPAAKTATEMSCDQLGVTKGHAYKIYMTAYDEANNESLPSNTVRFSWPDRAPGKVQQVCIAAEVDGKPVQLCGTP